MNILKFFKKKPETRSASAIGVNGWPIGLHGTGQGYASSRDAQNVSVFFASINAISSAVGTFPVLIHAVEGENRVEVNSGPIYDLFKYGPNQHQSTSEFFEMLMAEVLLHGNGLVEVVPGRGGEVEALRVVPWPWVQVQMLPNGKLLYDVYPRPSIYAHHQVERRLLQNQTIHIMDRSDDGLVGVPRLQRAPAVIKAALAVNEFAAAYMNNAAVPSLAFSTDKQLSPEAAIRLSETLRGAYAGARNAGSIVVLEDGLKADKMAFSPEDSELLDTRQFIVEEVARLFNIPPPLLQSYRYNTFTNAAQAARWFSQSTLMPWIVKLESAFNRALFMGTNLELSLDMSVYTRGDPEQRWAAHKIAVDAGILTPDEVRAVEGWSPKARESETPGGI